MCGGRCQILTESDLREILVGLERTLSDMRRYELLCRKRGKELSQHCLDRAKANAAAQMHIEQIRTQLRQ